jgi:hypothetical protein
MVCVTCAGSGDCIETSWGDMCRPCFHAALKVPPKKGPRLFTLPKPGQKIWVVMEPPETFLTIDGTLYGFEREEDAADLCEKLKNGYGITGAHVRHVEAEIPHRYVLSKNLRLIVVKERLKSDGELKSNEIPVPPL